MTLWEALAVTVAAGAVTVGGALVVTWAIEARRRRTRKTAQSRVDQARKSGGSDRPASTEPLAPPLPGSGRPGKRLRRSESRNAIDAFGVTAGRLWAVPHDDEPDPGPALVEYREWLTGAHQLAAEHAESLSKQMTSHPSGNDARWCLLHQTIGRAAGYRTALGRLPDEPPPTYRTGTP